MAENHTKQIINITDNAANHIKKLLEFKKSEYVGIRVGVKSGGCSGLSYTFEYATAASLTDDIVECKDVLLFVDFKATMYLINTTLDYVEEKIRSGFIFINPNVKGECGCGESFHV